MNNNSGVRLTGWKATLQSRTFLVVAIIVGVLFIDQFLKIWVKTHFYYGEDFRITSWFRLLFIENNGMAFGMEIGSKLFLTVLRIVLVIFLIWYVCKICELKSVKTGYLVCLALIIAGAAGNIIDCVFYGKIFNDPAPPQVAQLFPEHPYGTWMHGKVVDMLYFPLFEINFPSWMPIVGDKQYLFFQPVFNFADSAITVGILVLVFFYSSQVGSPTRLREIADGVQNGEKINPDTINE